MKAAIIGAGLGGLLAGAKLSKAGYDVEIFERLPFIGGRFANLEYKGFKLSTGALHMIPHGSRGPLARMLREVGARIEIIDSDPMAMIMTKNRTKIDFRKLFSFYEKAKLALLSLTSKIIEPEGLSFRDWVLRHFDNDLLRLADAFCGWALSLQAKEVPACEMLEIIHNFRTFKGPGIPVGGCGAITGMLAEVIESNGGKLHTRSCVNRIIIDEKRAVGVKSNGKTISSDVVISDIGHTETSLLYNCKDKEYLKKINKIKPSKGIKICLSSDEPLIGNTGVLLTPYAQRINGINEVTNADPSLAPRGKHLVMSHQTMLSEDLNHEINLGLNDLKTLFHDKFKILLVQSYSSSWPVNRAASGCDIGNATPLNNLYVVGDGAKGKGGIEVEGVALGVKNVMSKLI